MMVITLIASNTIISLLLEALSRPSIALRDSLINTINSGMMAGKLKMAIKVLLLPALELIPEIMVKTVAKLMLPKMTEMK
ncbi:conserved hypothetical protein [Sphingobacterium multivorum]|uniref:Uncharacterized protein n=1 Tax=Sphingobacterium multivorum TaxID=28454 RepID=A0A654BV90_SPHMU|nr:conserved hypothetical protein [Sphingobacterium multivorum]